MTSNRAAATVIAGAIVVAGPLGLLEWWSNQFYKSLLPAGVTATVIEHKKTTTHGFGPGGRELGLVVFQMDKTSIQAVQTGGIDYLVDAAAKRSSSDSRHRREYWDWRRTPKADLWSYHGEQRCDREPGIGAFLDYADFRCRLNKTVVRDVNQILRSPGAYYAEGQASSIIIVAPKEQKAVLAYNG